MSNKFKIGQEVAIVEDLELERINKSEVDTGNIAVDIGIITKIRVISILDEEHPTNPRRKYKYQISGDGWAKEEDLKSLEEIGENRDTYLT